MKAIITFSAVDNLSASASEEPRKVTVNAVFGHPVVAGAAGVGFKTVEFTGNNDKMTNSEFNNQFMEGMQADFNNVSNSSDFKVGDTAVGFLTITDKDNIRRTVYVCVSEVDDDRLYGSCVAIIDQVNGTDGENYTLTSQDKEEIAEAISTAPEDGLTYGRKGTEWVDLSDWILNEELYAYGVEFDTTISSPTLTRIGNMNLHRSLPIHNKMRGCLLSDDGEVNSYLPSQSWEGATLDGSAGQVMVEIPEHYRCFKALNAAGEVWDWDASDSGADYNALGYTRRQVWLSEKPLKGYKRVPKCYMSAYEASLQRSTSKLASVMNLDADYRGGNNNADWDNTYRSLLGRPASNISLTNSRTCARNRNANSTKWNCVTYGAHKTIFWLFTVEYATLNCQTAVNAELTTDGYKQGGLGNGVTTLSSTQWSNFNGYYPFVPCGHTNALGNGTGEVAYNMVDENGDDYATIYSNRYRGIENPFGHIWQWTDGILVDVRTDDYDGNYAGQNRVLVAQDPANFASHSTLADSYEGYEFRGLQARTSSSYIKEIIFGEYGDMMGEVVGGSSTTFFCDYNYTSVTSSFMRGVLFGGSAYYGSFAGLAFSSSTYAPSYSYAFVGSRLCFIPAE